MGLYILLLLCGAWTVKGMAVVNKLYLDAPRLSDSTVSAAEYLREMASRGRKHVLLVSTLIGTTLAPVFYVGTLWHFDRSPVHLVLVCVFGLLLLFVLGHTLGHPHFGFLKRMAAFALALIPTLVVLAVFYAVLGDPEKGLGPR